MTKAQIFTDIKALLMQDYGHCTDGEITIETLIADLGFDSLDTMEFIMKLEAQYKISFTDNDMTTLTTVGKVVDSVFDKIK